MDDIRRFIQVEIINDETVCIECDDDLILNKVLDSLGVMRLVAHIEEVEGISISAEDVTIENFSSLRLIDAYLLSRVNNADISPNSGSA